MKDTMMPTRAFEPAFDPGKDPFDPERVGFEPDPKYPGMWRYGKIGAGGLYVAIAVPRKTELYTNPPSDFVYQGKPLPHNIALAILRANVFNT